MSAAWADRAPLTARQLDALRRLEAWASASAPADDAPAPSLFYTLSPAGELVAHSEAEAPPGALAPIESTDALEAFALRAEVIVRERRHAPDHAHLRRLSAQRECASEMVEQCEAMRSRLVAKADGASAH
jgi:hypothetical protein